MGFSIADQLNQLPRGMDGLVLRSDPREMDGTFTTSDSQVGTPPAGIQGGPADLQYPGEVSAPGMGGKGGIPMTAPPTGTPGMGGKAGGPLSQIPIDMQGNVLTGDPQANIPTPPVMNPPQTGLPGLPVPVAPMTPIGPSLGNPGGPGVAPQQITRPAPVQPPMPGQSQGKANMLRPTRPRPINDNLIAGPGATMGGMNPVRGARPAPTVARPVSVASRSRGAGRGGLMR